MAKKTIEQSYALPEPVKQRLEVIAPAIQKAQADLRELVALSRELLNVPEDWEVHNTAIGFVPPEGEEGEPVALPDALAKRLFEKNQAIMDLNEQAGDLIELAGDFLQVPTDRYRFVDIDTGFTPIPTNGNGKEPEHE